MASPISAFPNPPLPSADKLQVRPRSHRLRKKLLAFTFACASFGLLLGLGVFYITKIYLVSTDLQETNLKTIGAIRCDELCDDSEIANDWDFFESDYVLDKSNRFFLNIDQPALILPSFAMHHSDGEFMLRFRSAATFQTPSRESWRLLSTTTQIGSHRLAVMVGYAERASWKMHVPVSSMDIVDSHLRELLATVVALLHDNNGQVEFASGAMRKITIDGYEVVDLSTNDIVAGGYQLPLYFPQNAGLPVAGTSFYRREYELYVVRTDESDRLLAASAQSIGDIRSLIALFSLVVLGSGIVGHLSAKSFLRKYFVLNQSRPSEIEEALKIGEGLTIEFKRNMSVESPNLEQVLQTVAAFANSDDGTLFIGIDDEAQLRGLRLLTPRQKDQLAQKIYQSVRQRIKPAPWIQVDFPELRGLLVCRIFVPRGEASLYFLDGVIYVRYGSTDVKADPHIVDHLLAAHPL